MIECVLISFWLWSRNVGVMKYTLFHNLTELEQINSRSNEIHGETSDSMRDMDHIHDSSCCSGGMALLSKPLAIRGNVSHLIVGS